MSPTMQGPHTSLKMPQLQPQRGSIGGVRRPETPSASMYIEGKIISF